MKPKLAFLLVVAQEEAQFKAKPQTIENKSKKKPQISFQPVESLKSFCKIISANTPGAIKSGTSMLSLRFNYTSESFQTENRGRAWTLLKIFNYLNGETLVERLKALTRFMMQPRVEELQKPCIEMLSINARAFYLHIHGNEWKMIHLLKYNEMMEQIFTLCKFDGNGGEIYDSSKYWNNRTRVFALRDFLSRWSWLSDSKVWSSQRMF